MKYFTLVFLLLITYYTNATQVNGVVKDSKGNILPFSSILIKGTAKGTTANAKGFYTLQLNNGNYTLVCQHIGFTSVEKKVKVVNENVEVDFILSEQEYKLTDVVIKSGSEDPAYEIIRKTIAKREEHLNEIKKYQVEVYIKGQMQLRGYPKKFMGETVDFEDGDTSKHKMIFLSETVANYSVDGNKKKVDVVSTRVSGSSNSFGFSSPQIISFYENNISIAALNPRGFISPISNNAFNFYKYKFEGMFFENGKTINRIKVIPKRKYEPLFSGYINIIEDEWRLQSVQLQLLKEQQMQYLDTLTIEQLYIPLRNIWVIKQQVIKPAGKIFSFDFFGSFLQVYDKFNIEPEYKKGFFGNTLMKFFDSSNKKSINYWDSIRPVPLSVAEAKDYKKKDSLEQERKSPHYLDSLDKKRNTLTLGKLFLTGYNYSKEKYKTNFSFEPLTKSFNSYNTVEGFVLSLSANYNKRFEDKKSLSLSSNFRYGLSNTHFNASINGNYNLATKYASSLFFGGGKNVFQFNNNNPIAVFNNSISTLWYTANHMKLYEAWYGRIGYRKALGDGFNFSVFATYQHRMPLENTTDYKFSTYKNRIFTPNFPVIPAYASVNIAEHNALTLTANLTWKPGAKYIEFPDRKINIGSRYPTFNLTVTKGINNLLGSDVDYTKWYFNISDNLNMKLGGRLRYELEAGGFLQADKVFTPDFIHYLGNQTVIASQYMKGFQLLPYYELSNMNNFYTAGHIEYHLNGLLSNKIPLFRKLNWFFVVGANALYINSQKNFYEAFFSIENIFKIIRVDFVQGYKQNGETPQGIKFSLPLLF
ncbi:MAG: carboxypeptidase-like regulatory domain-containing protein [Bacteroidetes bacterium]|nr:carboxypeptidase-like regulatory domain-containing protein [Bacteroidota bacterium]MBS1650056.1 carboxypeptidase-like regulatory domain-containing protein [Bacteroidota bacterium]